jgi:hypothetical protein
MPLGTSRFATEGQAWRRPEAMSVPRRARTRSCGLRSLEEQVAGKSKGAEVVATLMEESQIEDRFSVILEAGRWVIDDIIANGRSVRHLLADVQ